MNTNLLKQPVLLLDGGLGTSLEDLYHVKFSTDTPLWSSHLLISDPGTLADLQQAFADAGAQIILTPTYQASHAGFRKTIPGISQDEINRYMQSAVTISRAAAGNGLVALSLGAYGATLQPSQEYSGDYGSVDEAGLVAFHRERLEAFDLSKVDIMAFETIPRLDEIRAVKQVVDGSHPYWISGVFPNDNRLPDGTSIEASLAAMMIEPVPWAIGFNCTKVDKVDALIRDFESAAIRLGLGLPRLVLYPDGTNGEVYDTTTQMWVGKQRTDGMWYEKMYSIVQGVLQRHRWSGVIVGGCCKTTPTHLRELRNLLFNAITDQ